MLDWLFAPSCPCDPAAKGWVEDRLGWLADEFGDHAFNGRRLVLPAPEFFPDPYDASKKAVRRLLDRVCGYMDLVPDLVELRLMTNPGHLGLVDGGGRDLPTGAAGTFHEGERKFVIRISRDELADPTGLVGTVAHELAHVRLLGEGRIGREAFDNELLTDLTVVHFGLGVFLANGPRNWAGQTARWPGTGLRKPEYMTPPMFGWALAHLAWFRGEERPAWATHLTGAARADLRQGLRYLRATADSGYKPAKLRPNQRRDR